MVILWYIRLITKKLPVVNLGMNTHYKLLIAMPGEDDKCLRNKLHFLLIFLYKNEAPIISIIDGWYREKLNFYKP